MGRPATTPATPAAPAASRRVQPPRRARTDESREALRRRQLNLRPVSDSDAASSESEAPSSSSEVVGKYQGLVMEAIKELKSGTASQIITQAQTLIDGEAPTTVRKSLSVALGILRRKGLLQLEGREYLLPRKATTKKVKGRAPRGSVARKSHRPPLRNEDEEEEDDDEEDEDDKKARRGSVASKSVPLTARRAATQRLAQRRKKKTPAKKAAKKKADPAPKKKKKAAPVKKRAASAEEPEKKAPPKKKARTAPAASPPPAAAAAAPLEGAGTPADHHWEYHHKTWLRYTKEASDAVEEQYQAFLKDSNLMDVPAIQSGDWKYMVNFKDMTQTNIEHAAHTTRQIRRVPGP